MIDLSKAIWLKVFFIAVVITTATNIYYPCYAESLKIELASSYQVLVPFGPIENGFQKWHYGVDLKAIPNSPFFSPIDGWVHFKGFTPACTETLTIETDEGLLITFLNLYNVSLSKGARVKKGELLGFVSEILSGSTQTPHIHLSIRNKNGNYLNPLEFIIFPNAIEQAEEKEYGQNIEADYSNLQSEVKIKGLTQEKCIKSINHQYNTLTSNEKSLQKDKLQSTKNPNILREKPYIHTLQEYKTFPNFNSYPPGKAAYIKTTNPYRLIKLSHLDKKNFVHSEKNAYSQPELDKNKTTELSYEYAFLLLFSAIVVIICRQSLLPAMTGGRTSPKGGELVARIRDNVYSPTPVNT